MGLHRTVAAASGNAVYPLILKSFEPSIEHLIEKFYSDSGVVAFIRQKHAELSAQSRGQQRGCEKGNERALAAWTQLTGMDKKGGRKWKQSMIMQ